MKTGLSFGPYRGAPGDHQRAINEYNFFIKSPKKKILKQFNWTPEEELVVCPSVEIKLTLEGIDVKDYNFSHIPFISEIF